jgi:hypothetical protein
MHLIRTVLAAIWILAAVPLSALATPALLVTPTSLAVTGATPEGTVAWLSVSRRPLDTHQRVEIRRELGVADLTGHAELELADPVTAKSLWAVVDLTTGELALAAPPESLLAETALPPDSFEQDASGETVRLHHDRRKVEALVVRPSADRPSAWAGQVEDGGGLDEGVAYDGEIALSPLTLPPLAEDQPPAEAFAEGDVVVLIDPERLEISATRLEADGGRGGER